MAATLTVSSFEAPIELSGEDSPPLRTVGPPQNAQSVPGAPVLYPKRGPESPGDGDGDSARKRQRVDDGHGLPNGILPTVEDPAHDFQDFQPIYLAQPATPIVPQPPARYPSSLPRPTTPLTNSQPQPPSASASASRRRKANANLEASPENYRRIARAHEFHTREGRSDDAAITRSKGRNVWYHNDGHRPYLDFAHRENVAKGAFECLPRLGRATLRDPYIYHVDFEKDEVEYLRLAARKKVTLAKPPRDALKELAKILRKNKNVAAWLPDELKGTGPLRLRDELDIYYFLADVNKHNVSKVPETLTLQRGGIDETPSIRKQTRLTTLLYKAEMDGMTNPGLTSGCVNIRREMQVAIEDAFDQRMQWTDGPGDIITISWVSNDSFICGATEHMDSHNQQYNKPGNLLLCSTQAGRVQAFPDHRIPRPVVERGENSTHEMRESQSPWLYPSVVSSAYCEKRDMAFTSSFDRTVKVWRVPEEGGNMQLLGTWSHGGNVNFVVVSKHASGMVATAADVSVNSVRVYNVDVKNVSASPYRAFGHRIGGPMNEPLESDKWAYFPSTIQWGLAESCRHHLLVGYSPRSLTIDDVDIPEDKRNTGVMRLWNTLTGSEVALSTTIIQNVFEVAWHPTKPVFIVAASAARSHPEHRVLTQIRVFALSTNTSEILRFQQENRSFVEGFSASEFYASMQILDCYSSDINEITIRPNSHECSYVTAATTDGRVYVWDTADGDKPIHILEHGHPVEEFNGDREKEDVGVKFTAWGRTLDRFYTGGSDGFVKVWNVRHRRPLVRNLLEVTGPVSFGSFSPDHSKLAIGDASGRIFLLTDDPEDNAFYDSLSQFVTLPGGVRRRKPKPVELHAEPPPPPGYELPHGPTLGRRFLATEQLRRRKDPTLGVFQGPNYHQAGFYRAEAHWDMDPAKGLRADLERVQQVNKVTPRSNGLVRPFQPIVALVPAARAHHQRNDLVDEMTALKLDADTRAELEREGAELEPDYGFDYESAPEFSDSDDEDESSDDEGDVYYEMQGGQDAGRSVSHEDVDDSFVKKPHYDGAAGGLQADALVANRLTSSSSEDEEEDADDDDDEDADDEDADDDDDEDGPSAQLHDDARANSDDEDNDEMSVLSESSVKDVFTKPGIIPITQDDSADEDWEGESEAEESGESEVSEEE